MPFNPAGNPCLVRVGMRTISSGLSYKRKTTGQVKLESEDTTSVRAWRFVNEFSKEIYQSLSKRKT